MLSKSFKPAKCKTSLKLAVSRIKLLRNKRDIQIKQMRRELAQLIENGQEQTARIRVEHVIREEKTSAAYELIELFCELLAARMPIIDSQKYCPVDLKEAVATVIFASPRCSDIPELMDIRKNFAAKYGKEFTNAALEIRPDCGVSRLVVEKLSARAPYIETKMKTLKAIAGDHNVKWDSKSFEDQLQKPHEDLLNGPTSFAGATKYHTEQYTANPSPSPIPTQTNVSSINIPQTPKSESRTSGGEGSISNSGNAEFPSTNQTAYPMEYLNATSAAQAAAESAERARIAARAAARFASHENMSRQTSTVSNATPTYDSKYERPENLRVFLDESSSEEPAASLNHGLKSSQEVKPKVHNPRTHEHIQRKFSNNLSSNSSPVAPVNYEVKSSQEVKPEVQNLRAHEQIQRGSSNYFSSSSSLDFVNDDILDSNFHKGYSNIHLENYSTESKAEDPSPRTVEYGSIKYDDDVESSKVESFYDDVKDKDIHNLGITHHENYEEDNFRRGASIKQTSFNTSPAVVFDNYNHVDEGSSSSVWRKNETLFDTHPEEESSNYHSSTSPFSDKISTESFAKPSNSQLHLFTASHAEEHPVPSLANVSPTPAFDASDEESSDIEDPVYKNSSFSRKSSIKTSFSDDEKEVPKNDSRLYERKLEADSIKVDKYNFSSSDEEEPPLPQRVTRILTKEKPKSSEFSENLSDEKQGINFGLLTGGLKHKSVPRPAYVKKSDSTVQESPIAKEQESLPKAYASQSKTKLSYFDSPESDNDEHLLNPTQDLDYPKSQKKAHEEVNSTSLGAFSDYNTTSSRVNANVKHSRRTRDVMPATTRNTTPKAAESKPELPAYEDSSKPKQVQTTYGDSLKLKQVQTSHEDSSKPKQVQTTYVNSSKLKQVQTTYEDSSKPKQVQTTYGDSSKLKQVQTTREESSKPVVMKSLSGESLKSTGSASNEDSGKKASSRTHPKLPPDYDTFAAHFHALRSNKR